MSPRAQRRGRSIELAEMIACPNSLGPFALLRVTEGLPALRAHTVPHRRGGGPHTISARASPGHLYSFQLIGDSVVLVDLSQRLGQPARVHGHRSRHLVSIKEAVG